MNSHQSIGRSHSRKHYHQQSMDDFMKNIKKFNLRSQRYISPKPLLYMYAKNNTTNTIDKSRSRTLSNHKSHSKSKRSKKEKNKSSSKTIRHKLEKIFTGKNQITIKQHENPATFIQNCGNKLKKAQKYLQGKSVVGLYLCTQFLSILNQIVQKMVKQLDRQLHEIEHKTQKQIQRRYTRQITKLQHKIAKMDKLLLDMTQKADNNSKLMYELRMVTNMDVDYLFGRAVLGTELCGGQGYGGDKSFSIQGSDQDQHSRDPGELSRGGREDLRDQPRKKFEKELKLQLTKNNQFIEQKESGRIRQAYDWQREAYDDRERKKQPAARHLITELDEEPEEEEYQRGGRKST